MYFNPLPSCEGRLRRDIHFMRMCRFQSTPLMRGETFSACNPVIQLLISIHSPHARGDRNRSACTPHGAISIHSPHARGDLQSLTGCRCRSCHFNPLPSCEGRRDGLPVLSPSKLISIHSPHARGDRSLFVARPYKSFQSTPLMRGETAHRGRDRD